MGSVLSRDELSAIDAYWRAANYLSVDARTTSDPGRGPGGAPTLGAANRAA